MAPEQINSPEKERIFWPRTSEVIGQLVESVQQNPEQPLTEEEITEVLQFESDLFEGKFGDLRSEKGLDELESVGDIDTRIYPAYFMTDKGREKLQEASGKQDVGETEEEITEALFGLPISSLQDKEDEIKKLGGDSAAYVTEYYVDAVANDKIVPELDSILLCYKPALFLAHVSSIVTMKRFVQEVQTKLRQQAQERPSNLTDANLAIAQIYRDKMNAVLAEDYPKVQEILRQYDAQIPEERARLTELLDEIPAIVGVARAAMGTPSIQSQFVRLLDYVRNGAALDADGKLTPIDGQIFDDIGYYRTLAGQPVEGEAIFSAEEVQTLQEIQLDPESARALAEKYAQNIGVDVKVVIRDDKTSLAYSSPQNSVWIPGKYSAKLVKKDGGTGAVLVIVHEIGGTKPGHAVQTENAKRNDKALRLATSPIFRGKRYVSLREAGSIVTENATGERLFGMHRSASASYARAMESLLKGEPTYKAVAAFALDQMAEKSDKNGMSAAVKLGANRVQRLSRAGGRDSQPLQYVEAATVRRAIEPLSDELQNVILAEGTLDPVDMLRLHRFGLLNTDAQLFEPRQDPEKAMVELLREQIAQHRSR